MIKRITMLIMAAGFLGNVQAQSIQEDDTTKNIKQLEGVVLNSNKALNELSLMAGKIPIDPMKLPQSIVTIQESVIKNQQAQKLSDIIKNVNGVYLGTTRGGVQETFYARGYRLRGDNMYKNGVRVPDGVMPETGSLQAVEILKGSAAILYGAVEPGGIINMVTKQPKFRKGGEVSVRTGSFGLFKPAIDIYGPASEKIALRLNTIYETTNSFRDEVSSEKLYVNPSALVRVSAKTDILLQADYLHQDFTSDFGLGSLGNSSLSNLPRNIFLGTPWQYNKQKQYTSSALLTHKINRSWTAKVNAAAQRYDRDYYSIERIQAAANGDWARPLNKIESQENYYSGGIDLQGSFKTKGIEHKLLVGVDADEYSSTVYAFDNPKIYDTINILDAEKFARRTDIPVANKITKVETPRTRVGAYVQDLIMLSPQWTVLAGLRYSSVRNKASKTTNLKNDVVTMGTGNSDQAFSPRAGIVFSPVKTTSVFASYANSFSANSGLDVQGNAIKPSIIDQYEVGIKNKLWKEQLSINLTLYKIRNNNLAQTAPFLADGTPNNNTNIKELSGETTSNGIEVDMEAILFKRLKLIGGYAYNDMRFTKTKAGDGNYIEGERLINTPAHTANLSGFYKIKADKLKGMQLGFTASYIGKRVAGWNNKQSQSQNYDRTILVNSFTTVDLTAGYEYKKFNALFKVVNVTNTYNYYVHENYSINPLPPASVVATIAYRL